MLPESSYATDCHITTILNVYTSYIVHLGDADGHRKISDALHDDLRLASLTMTRSINAQAEYWIKIGMLAEFHPELTYPQLVKK